MAFKRRYAGYRRRTYGRRYARGRSRFRGRAVTRSRRVYNPRGTNPNQIIELKNVDYYAAQEPIVTLGADDLTPISWANASVVPDRVLSGTTGVNITGATPPWNAVSQGTGSNQRDGRKINCVKLLIRYGIQVMWDAVASTSNPASIVHVMVVLDTATNLAIPSMGSLLTGLGQAGDVAATRGGPSMFPFPNPSGVNRFRILKHKIHRPQVTYDAATKFLGPITVGQLSVDLKGLPVTFVQGGATTPQSVTVADIVDNSIYILMFSGSYVYDSKPSFLANVSARLLFTG